MKQLKQWIPCLIGCLLLGGVAADREMFHAAAQNATGYHARIRKLTAEMPSHVGNWVSQETPVLAAAVALLRPNVVMERHYENLSNGLQASMLLVQCSDARDLVGHYPPICYPAHGWKMVEDQPHPFTLGSLHINGTMYQFSSSTLSDKNSIKVFDFMILPNGNTAPDMRGVYAIARNRLLRYFGAAQIQIVFDASMPDEDQDKVIRDLLSCANPVIEAIRMGEP